MRIDNPTGFTSNLTGSFTGSFFGDGSGLTGTNSGSWDGDFTGSAEITGSLRITGSISLSGSFKDQENSPGTAGQVLSSTVSGSQWVDVGGSGIGDVTKTGTIVANQIAIWNNATNQLRSDPTFVIDSNYKITLYQPRVSGGSSNIDSYNIGGGNLANVTGGNNAGFGNNNLFNITTGQQNTAFGNQSLYNNTEGLLNTAIGHTALYSNTTGGNNIAIGNQALYSNTEGSNNIGIGVFSVLNNTTGIKNIGIGRNSLSSTTGDGNIAIGFEAGKNITTGDNNVIIGTNTGSTIATSNNNIIISDGSGNNRLQFGSTGDATFSGIVNVGGAVSSPASVGTFLGVVGRSGVGAGTAGIVLKDFDNAAWDIWNSGGNLSFRFNNTAAGFVITSGGAATFSSSVAISEIATITQTNAGTENRGLRLTNTAGSRNWNITAGRFDQNNDDFTIRCADTNVDALYLSATGAATFLSSSNPVINVTSSDVDNSFITFKKNTGTTTGHVGGSTSILSASQGGVNTDFIIRSENALKLLTNGNNPRLTISSGGDVGIGTLSTSANSLQKYLSITDNYNVGIVLNDTRGSNAFEIFNAGEVFHIAYGSSSRFSILSGGEANFSGNLVVKGQNTSHEAASLKISQESASLSELRCYGADNGTVGSLRIVASKADGSDGGTRLTISQTGNVTISSLASSLGQGTITDCMLQLTNTTTVNSYSQIGFGYMGSSGGVQATYAPAYIGFKSTNGGGHGYGQLTMGVRTNTSGAVQPTEIFVLQPWGTIELKTVITSGNPNLQIADLAGSGNRSVYSTSTGALTNSSSDVTLKENVNTIAYGLDKVLKLNPISFNWINKKKLGDQKEIGFIAQEVQSEIPELIGENSDGTLSLDYPKIVSVLTKAIQEQQTIIEDLKARIETLEG